MQAYSNPRLVVFLILLLCFIVFPSRGDGDQSKKHYIVLMDNKRMPNHFDTFSLWYQSHLSSVSNNASITYIYDTLVNGFSAMMKSSEANLLQRKIGTHSVIQDSLKSLQTTRTPKFLGLEASHLEFPTNLKKQLDVIVGVLDSGIDPKSRSFDDSRMSSVPKHWKGRCPAHWRFCNKKLIGADYFHKGYENMAGPLDERMENKSPMDFDGHGTHTSATAAGTWVTNASLYGLANGTARGMAIYARIAVYKVCWDNGCGGSDILAGMEKAVNDGVHVLSLSIGGVAPEIYYDAISIASFRAVERGVFVSCSAGNSGPAPNNVENTAPWIMTVGASSIDRNFPAHVILGNSESYVGESLYTGRELPVSMPGIVYAGDVSTGASRCLNGTLDPRKVKGKIVVCDRGLSARVEKGLEVKRAGGIGMVLTNASELADSDLIPAVHVNGEIGNKIKSYIHASQKVSVQAKATFQFLGTKLGTKPAPAVSSFSSRGPNPIFRGILKPDVIAPGVNILSAWSRFNSPTGIKADHRRTEYNIISGTSMSCPHVSGIAALIKAFHPGWSPAAILSAIVTTANTKDNEGNKISDLATGKAATYFAMGAGNVNPLKAVYPGLVYDLDTDDYINFLCALNYTSKNISAVAGQWVHCSKRNGMRTVADLNYPSITVVLQPLRIGEPVLFANHSRTLTNVGPVPSVYTAEVFLSETWFNITVHPQTLIFTSANPKRTYFVSFIGSPPAAIKTSFAYIEWTDRHHVVRSPIVVNV